MMAITRSRPSLSLRLEYTRRRLEVFRQSVHYYDNTTRIDNIWRYHIDNMLYAVKYYEPPRAIQLLQTEVRDMWRCPDMANNRLINVLMECGTLSHLPELDLNSRHRPVALDRNEL